MEHYHIVGDIIKVNRNGPPKYYKIEKITEKQFLVKKMPVYLVSHDVLPNGELSCKFWLDRDRYGPYFGPASGVWISGPDKKYVHKMQYPVYDGRPFTMIQKAPIWS